MSEVNQQQPTPEEILAEFEWGTSLKPHQKTRLLGKAIDILEAQGRTEEAQKAKWEYALFLLHRRELDAEKNGRFGPMFEGNDGTQVPDPAIFTEDALAYYEERLRSSTNPVLRSWYADYLWERRHNHLFAREAIMEYHQCYSIYVRNTWWEEAADSLVRPMRLALKLNDASLIQDAKDKVHRALDDLSKRHSHPEVRYCLDLVAVLLELNKRATRSDLKKALAVCQVGAEFYASEQAGWNYHIARSFVARVATILSRLGYNKEADLARARIGKYLEDEAELKGRKSNLVGALFLQEAIHHYSKIGRADKVEELKIRLRERYQAAIEGKEFKEVSAEMTIPVGDIRKRGRELLKYGLDKALIALSVDESLIPDIDEARKQAQRLKQDAPLLSLLPRSNIRGTRQVQQATSQEEIDEANALQQYALDASLRGEFFSLIWKIFIDEGGLNASLLSEQLARSPFIEKDILAIVEVGIERYFAGDYVSAIHVLVPKLEETLRRAIGKLGISTTSQGVGGFTREKPLDEILKTPELIKLLGPRKVFYFEYMLILQLGENLRNDVAHGLLTKERCTKQLTEKIIHMYILLTPFEAKASQQV